MVRSAANEAAVSLRRAGRPARLRQASWIAALGVLCACLPTLSARWRAPSEAELAALRHRRDLLMEDVAALERETARLDLRTCGNAARICVRVDRSSPPYGEHGDYYVAAGR
jgi:hypothetical protein